jgi:hypothetical protein
VRTPTNNPTRRKRPTQRRLDQPSRAKDLADADAEPLDNDEWLELLDVVARIAELDGRWGVRLELAHSTTASLVVWDLVRLTERPSTTSTRRDEIARVHYGHSVPAEVIAAAIGRDVEWTQSRIARSARHPAFARVMALHRSGASMSEIVATTGRSPTSVKRWLAAARQIPNPAKGDRHLSTQEWAAVRLWLQAVTYRRIRVRTGIGRHRLQAVLESLRVPATLTLAKERLLPDDPELGP